MNKVPLLVLVGGLGTRMRRIYPDLPKFLIPIDEKKFADYWLDSLDNSCISQIYFLVSYKAEMIIDYLKKKELSIPYTIINEGDKPLGTGGAIKNALQKIKDDSFFLTYGDTILSLDWNRMLDIHLKNSSSLTFSIFKNEGLTDQSNIYIDNGKIYYDKFWRSTKMKYIEYGLSLINKKDFIRSTKYVDKFDLSSWFTYTSLCYKNITYLMANKEYFEIGTEKALENFRDSYKQFSQF